MIVSSQFGFGAINAEAYVNRARQWVPVDEAIDTYRVIFDRLVDGVVIIYMCVYLAAIT